MPASLPVLTDIQIVFKALVQSMVALRSSGGAACSSAGERHPLQCSHVLFPRSSPLFSTATTSSASVLCSSDQLRDVVSLALELLPPLPEPAQIVEENRRIIAGAQCSRHPSCVPSDLMSDCVHPVREAMPCHAVDSILPVVSWTCCKAGEHPMRWRLPVQGKQGRVALSRMLSPQAPS